jgi:hypothetical protein
VLKEDIATRLNTRIIIIIIINRDYQNAPTMADLPNNLA